ncbi:hypothetical protein PHYPSEUDO_005804 [Phytophthora pseudosyringae]|uniref:START domain-containing protein n=1 Tax=Phytophthora pseudosyringae TaxID=221518 RepID=A0A8T1VNE9_9STRA|nr:hypothetical protein PHYPSEUDO_005804 [Phytophthora pseudosyringae]
MVSRGGPFQTLKLTVEERQLCHDRAFLLLDRTLRSYDERDGQAGDGRPSSPRHHANLDSTRWKLLKTQTDASLYTARRTRTLQDQNLLGGEWENPVVALTAGTIRGDLDEVMLGLETPDSSSFRARAQLFTKQRVDCAVLTELLGPTDIDPFRFLGVMWMVYEYKWPIKPMVKPRDFVTLTATGTMTRANGEWIGYEIAQPARLPHCPPLPGPTIRGKVMYAAIFKQQEPGVVDVFVTTYVETQGVILDKLVASITWKATIGFWDAPQLAEVKKLQWCIANCRSERQKEQQRASSSVVGVCKACHDRWRMEKQLRTGRHESEDESSCVLCASPTCYKCRVERTLKVVDRENSARLADQLVLVCQPCWMFVQKLRPTDIAKLSRKQRLRQQCAIELS